MPTQLKQIIDAATEPWGIEVVAVETKDVGLPDTMKRAIARHAEAERKRRAKVIAAHREYQAAERLSQNRWRDRARARGAHVAHAADAGRAAAGARRPADGCPRLEPHVTP